ncbi:MAG: histidine phosphatase family protein [Phototrophicaceae bacterium]
MRLHLIRHAQSLNNAHELTPEAEHVLDAPLTPLGEKQATHLAAFIQRDFESSKRQHELRDDPRLAVYQFDELYTSPMQRTLQTTNALTQTLNIPATIHPDIYERGGVYHEQKVNGQLVSVGKPGLNAEAMRVICANLIVTEGVTSEGWWFSELQETPDHYEERVFRVAKQIREWAIGDKRHASIAFVTHGGFSNALMQALLFGVLVPRTLVGRTLIGMYNTSTSRVDFDAEGTPTLRYASRTDHLAPEMVTA